MTTLLVGHGLLGRRVAGVLRDQGERVVVAVIPWHDPGAALEALKAAVDAIDGPWRLVWSAGAGVVATPKAALDAEVALFTAFAEHLSAVDAPAAVFLASSAGGLYAGSAAPPFTERHQPRPLAAYGHAKLAMEEVTRGLTRVGSRVAIGRISNLYGPGQDLRKPQGLVSQLALTHVTGRPLQLYVSLDTLRDYVYVDDAARLVVAILGRVAAQPAGTVVTKIIASNASTSVAALLDASIRAFRRRPHVVQCASRGGSGQVLDLRLRSVVWTDLDVLAQTPLQVGLRATADDVEAQYRSGLLAGI